MVKHIVLWKLKEQAHGNDKHANVLKIKNMLESLAGKIPGLIHIEAGIDFSGTDMSKDIALYAEFESREALDIYQKHPLHQAMMPFIMEARQERHLIDYETL